MMSATTKFHFLSALHGFSRDDMFEARRSFLRDDIAFHRAVAAVSKNQIMASLVEMVSGMFFEMRKRTATVAAISSRSPNGTARCDLIGALNPA